MNQAAGSTIMSDEDPAQVRQSAVGDVARDTAAAVRHAGNGIAEFGSLIRHQPITMAFLMLGIGYVLGRVSRAGAAPQRKST